MLGLSRNVIPGRPEGCHLRSCGLTSLQFWLLGFYESCQVSAFITSFSIKQEAAQVWSFAALSVADYAVDRAVEAAQHRLDHFRMADLARLGSDMLR